MEDLSYLKPAEPNLGFRNDVHECNERIPKSFSFSTDERQDDAIQVYLRLKPDCELSRDGFLSLSEEEQNSLLLKKKSSVSKFSFSYIFKPNASQHEVFVKSTEGNLQDFLNGKNAFIFTYGTSSSGKTFTIQGNKNNPGLIPRIIATIFATLENNIDESYRYCPERSVSVVELTENEMFEKFLLKEKYLTWARSLVQQQLQKSDDVISFEEFKKLFNSSKKLEIVNKDNCVFSIWFSFCEIYNEKIYDLFDLQKEARTPLYLSTDLDKRVFIKGLQHIHVTTLEEAYFLYYYGCYNRSVSYTSLNERSSRSHSIFTIKILGRQKDSSDNFFITSSFSVCDLAGTERFSKTKNHGSRMKESQSINSSFLVLNRCLKIIRENQLRDFKQVVPYRESKLTQLMGTSFTTRDTNLVMIVTVAQSQNLMDETETSLKSSAIATEIKAMIETPVKKKKKMRFSSAFSHLNPGRGVNWNEIVSNRNVIPSSLPLQDGNLELLRALEKEKIRRQEAEAKLVELEKAHREEIESLITEHKYLSDQQETESIRDKELEASKVQQQEQELASLRKQQEELYEKYMNSRASILSLQKKLRLLKDDYDQLKTKHEGLESTCEELEDMLDDAKEEVEELQKENKELHEAILAKDEAIVLKDEKISFLELEVNQLEDNLQDNAEERDVYDKLVKALEDSLRNKEEEIKELNEKLMTQSRSYEDEIKLLKKKLEGQNSRESRRVKGKNGNIPILRIQDASFSDDDDTNRQTPCMRRSRSAGYRNMLSDSDDPSFLLPARRKIVTSKKKKRRQAKDLENSYYFDGKSDSASTSRGQSARRRLYKKTSEEELGEPSDTFNGDSTQASPNTILRTLRTGKKY